MNFLLDDKNIKFINTNWIELNKTLQSFIIHKMLNSFNEKKYNKILNIYERFSKKKCVVNLYYENNNLEGICISWKIDKFIYLDKFFSINFKKGVGGSMLKLFIEKYKNDNVIWRTNEDLTYFYLKNNSVNKFFNYGTNHEKDYVFMGIKNHVFWEYEDINNLKINSCFQ
jgi:hypothetical protein